MRIEIGPGVDQMREIILQSGVEFLSRPDFLEGPYPAKNKKKVWHNYNTALLEATTIPEMRDIHAKLLAGEM